LAKPSYSAISVLIVVVMFGVLPLIKIGMEMERRKRGARETEIVREMYMEMVESKIAEGSWR